jgi:hypothetical protein
VAGSGWHVAALPTRRAKPQRITEQDGRDLKGMLQLGLLFFGGAALLATTAATTAV